MRVNCVNSNSASTFILLLQIFESYILFDKNPIQLYIILYEIESDGKLKLI